MQVALKIFRFIKKTLDKVILSKSDLVNYVIYIKPVSNLLEKDNYLYFLQGRYLRKLILNLSQKEKNNFKTIIIRSSKLHLYQN